ncbi:MAG: hypothetical protein ACKVZ0_12520 [Gemmatimonadales bacterium]
MNLENGLQLERPAVFVPWSATRDALRQLFPEPGIGRQGLKEVTGHYFVLSDVLSLGGLCHELGFHFGIRGRLAELEYFRRSYEDVLGSYTEFQRHLESSFGPPTRREPGDEGCDRCVWQLTGAEVFHELVDRFGPEEHLRIVRLPRRLMLA